MKLCLNGGWGVKKIGEGGKWCPECLGEFESLPGLGGPLGRAMWWQQVWWAVRMKGPVGLAVVPLNCLTHKSVYCSESLIFV